MQVKITNASQEDILAVFTKTTDKNIPDVKFIPNLYSGASQNYHTNTGTMNLYVFTKSGLAWGGPVPTLIQGSLVYSDQGVSYEGKFFPSMASKGRSWWWLGIIVIVLLVCCWLLWKKMKI